MPLPLGFTSECEYVDLTLQSNMMPYMIESLEKSLPDGMTLYDARAVLDKRASLSSALNRVVYRVDTAFWEDSEKLRGMVRTALDADILEVERQGKKETKRIDIRPVVFDLTILENNLVMELGIGDEGYVRPGELLYFLAAGLKADIAALSVHRCAFYRIESDGSRIDPMEL